MADPALVIGGGSWGTALANLLAGKGIATTIWAREQAVVAAINTQRENTTFLPGIPLAEALEATGDLAGALGSASIIVNAVPTQFIRSTYAPVAGLIDLDGLFITVSKGIEVDTLQTPNEIFAEVVGAALGERIVALSGPSFAREVGAEHPTAVVAASRDLDRAHRTQELFATETFRVYATDDIVSVELGGALKNVVAIAAGIVEGLRYGHNTMAALITRGIAEITRLGVALGGNPMTFAGLSGMGDLVLTCTGGLSRNRSVGVELGRGRPIDEILGEMEMVAEGVKTTQAVVQLASSVGVEMPIAEQVHAVIYEGKDPRLVPRELMVRQLKDEREGT
ncbi:MAG: NAD(P)H-dependent glycerol-3-phosphate dehydrogenase [Acidimicrobiia bacterium]|nr:NAD(P)H-dependent glycerol-3-phosphate dehydrogenase [Acidimicrobiia bacterium]